jgi:glutamate/tyrosine decarboxylase-like PLP-dependent enzyme
VVTEAGNVNSGAFDPIADIVAAARRCGAWVHVDGAFGLWARASGRRGHLAEGVEEADSWSVDAHKWLNVPYDSGLAITRHPAAHQAALGHTAAYLVPDADSRHDPMNWNPEHSRRARGIAIWATLRALGRDGVTDLVDRLCDRAEQFAEALAAVAGVEVLNDVVLNQVLVRFTNADDPDAHTAAVIARVQADGTCWLSGTTWQGHTAMRISVSNWATTSTDVERSVAAILRCAGLEPATTVQ